MNEKIAATTVPVTPLDRGYALANGYSDTSRSVTSAVAWGADGMVLIGTRLFCRPFITDEELNAKIRQEGVEAHATVERMYLEADGEMSQLRNDEPKAAA